MLRWRILDTDNNEELNKYVNFVDGISHSGVWFYPNWLSFQKASGRARDGFIFAVEDEKNDILATGMYLIQRSSFKINYAYIPAGLLFKEFNREIYELILTNVATIAKEEKVLYTQLDSITPFNKSDRDLLGGFKRHIFKQKLPIPTWTNVLNLKLSEEELLSQMKPKGRYNIRLAQKKGIEIYKGTENDIDLFYQMALDTASRDKFRLNPKEYYLSMLKNLSNSVLLFAKHESDVLCGGIFTYTKNQGLYYYGASANIKRNLMAPYLLQWEAIKIAKEKNCLFYDFLGIADPDDKKDQLISVTDFKLKFGGEVVRFQEPYHIIHNVKKYYIYRFLKNLKRFF
ncbi:MAG TPA: peptidoglycan bridge formation glycyltransferase FemA/FemB family protein [Spirochaetota bacterium]|jgi:lipid II:glycine glycyltransferase (peptidoglycan interpeptide bridge formation enzyme)|nr:MAG: FemAB family protein [Spirochaetes bacterium ADurb.Bin133]HNZ26410.1 peptidoglycan bridge formation glycyltransferase FemA/FemB family protein [Spirochaetota bacterium]HPY87798.1 peptidoglycan bridge formation glycyltransferase FemA/FemB family protein [Spirochaetota bacterium]